MKLNYYVGDDLLWADVYMPCPGCGNLEHLAMHAVPISHLKKLWIFYVQCNCGWKGPKCSTANLAIMKWDARVPIYT